MMRTGIALIALGRLRRGSRVSAAVVPISSVPANEKMAIWKPAKKPLSPWGNAASGCTRCDSEAVTPVGDTNAVAISTRLTAISASTAMILMIANQNSTSPKAFTVSTLRVNRVTSIASAGAQAGAPGNQYWKKPPTTTASPTTATLQLSQYDQPRKNAARGPM
jgi:hypothetical protein